MKPGRAATETLPRPRARRGEGQKLRDELLAATERLLAETGDADAISIRTIAEAVRVTPPSIYLHFADKDDLIRAVCQRDFACFDAAVEVAGNRADDPVESLTRRAHAYVRFGLEHPEPYRVLFMSRYSPSGDLASGPGALAFQHLVDAVQRCIRAGAFRAGLDPFVTAVGLWTAVHGVTSLLISLPDFPWPDFETLLDQVCSAHLGGLIDHRSHEEDRS